MDTSETTDGIKEVPESDERPSEFSDISENKTKKRIIRKVIRKKVKQDDKKETNQSIQPFTITEDDAQLIVSNTEKQYYAKNFTEVDDSNILHVDNEEKINALKLAPSEALVEEQLYPLPSSETWRAKPKMIETNLEDSQISNVESITSDVSEYSKDELYSPKTKRKVIKKKIIVKKPKKSDDVPEKLNFKAPKQHNLQPKDDGEKVDLKPFTKKTTEETVTEKKRFKAPKQHELKPNEGPETVDLKGIPKKPRKEIKSTVEDTKISTTKLSPYESIEDSTYLKSMQQVENLGKNVYLV